MSRDSKNGSEERQIKKRTIGTERKLTALSLFSGGGGMDLGVTEAGFDILASVEIDPFCCETLRTNIGMAERRSRIIESDIRLINPQELLESMELTTGELDLLFGGPPCQAFSQIGKRKSLDDERGILLFEMIRFAKIFKPKAILIEQVKGFLNATDGKGKPGGVFSLLLSELEGLGYSTKWKVINSADWGVPQKRERVFIVSTSGPNKFRFPPPTHGPAGQTSLFFELKPFVTVGEALEGLGPPGLKNGDSSEGSSHIDVTPEGDRNRIHGVPEGDWLARQFQLPATQRKNLCRKDTTKFRRLSRSESSLTLRCGEIFYHYSEDRYLTPRECMRLHAYPDKYLLKGPIRGRSGRVLKLDQHRQIANSVPPPVAKIIASAIVEVI